MVDSAQASVHDLNAEREIREGEAACLRYRDALDRAKEDILPMARGLLRMRRAYPDDISFGNRLRQSPYADIEKDDRACLIKIGEHEHMFAKLIPATHHTRPRTIWDAFRHLVEEMVSHRAKPGGSDEETAETCDNPDEDDETAEPENQLSDGRADDLPKHQPKTVTRRQLKLNNLGKLPNAEHVLGYILNKKTNTYLGKLLPKKSCRPIWDLLVESIESGAFGKPSQACVEKPTLRVVLPWAPLAFAQRFDLTRNEDIQKVKAFVLPTVRAHHAVLQEQPDQLGTLVQEAIIAKHHTQRTEAEQRARETAKRNMAVTETEIVAFGTLIWPRVGDQAFTYQELCSAVWFFQFLEPQLRQDWDAKSKALQFRQIVKYMREWASAGVTGALLEIVRCYEESPDAKCDWPHRPVNYGVS